MIERDMCLMSRGCVIIYVLTLDYYMVLELMLDSTALSLLVKRATE